MPRSVLSNIVLRGGASLPQGEGLDGRTSPTKAPGAGHGGAGTTRDNLPLWGIAKQAHACQDPRFQNLYRLLDAKLLLGGWDALNQQAARGEGRVTAVAYEQALIAPIQDWV
ncbi:MAG: hypothetical protein GKR94_23485 [Gammaproteobacteria bacterium]|nr:hypothetical protein [Gammaproteobacteria bacterium]